VLSGTLIPSATTTTFSITVTDAEGVGSDPASFTITVTNPFVRQSRLVPSDSGGLTFPVKLNSGVTAGDALVLTVAQACSTATLPAVTTVDSHVTGVTGGTVTWTEAAASGCHTTGANNGDAEIWYGLHTAAAATGSVVTVTLATTAPVQYAGVTEYAGLGGSDPAATASADGTGTTVSPGSSTPSAAGELVVSSAYVSHMTATLAGKVVPFVPLATISPYSGFGAWAVDATTDPLSYSFVQTVGGVPTAGSWSAAIAAFTFTP
jgi:hypothetical protein